MIDTYSTCRGCGQVMLVVDCDTVHPNCAPRPRRVESLAVGWLTATLARDHQSARLTGDEIDQIDRRAPNLRAAALAYAQWGWPVFPLAPRSKIPAISKAKGGNGVKDANTDPGRIDRWWSKHPDHNIGLATGFMFDVLDIDPRHGGATEYVEMVNDEALHVVCHGISTTAAGGMHLLIEPVRKRGNLTDFEDMNGIDLRQIGGYIVAPPSTLGQRGRSWSWQSVPSPKVKRHRATEPHGRLSTEQIRKASDCR